VAAVFGCVVALGIAGPAFAQLVQLDYNAAKTFGTVEMDGGAIDLTSGAIIVTTSSFGFVPQGTGTNEYMTNGVGNPEYGDAAIHDAISEGANYNAGFWNGTNGITSSVAANSSYPGGLANPNLMGVGWVDDSVATYSVFRGLPVNASQSIITTTWYGDANLDGTVDASDYGLLANTILTHTTLGGGPPEWIDGDFNNDGVVDASDYGLLANSILLGVPPLGYNPSLVGASASVSPVPEPGTLALIASLAGFGLLAGLYRRFRS